MDSMKGVVIRQPHWGIIGLFSPIDARARTTCTERAEEMCEATIVRLDAAALKALFLVSRS